MFRLYFCFKRPTCHLRYHFNINQYRFLNQFLINTLTTTVGYHTPHLLSGTLGTIWPSSCTLLQSPGPWPVRVFGSDLNPSPKFREFDGHLSTLSHISPSGLLHPQNPPTLSPTVDSSLHPVHWVPSGAPFINWLKVSLSMCLIFGSATQTWASFLLLSCRISCSLHNKFQDMLILLFSHLSFASRLGSMWPYFGLFIVRLLLLVCLMVCLYGLLELLPLQERSSFCSSSITKWKPSYCVGICMEECTWRSAWTVWPMLSSFFFFYIVYENIDIYLKIPPNVREKQFWISRVTLNQMPFH